MTVNSKKFQFVLNPEPRDAEVNISQGNFVEIAITAQNRSLRPVRVQAILKPLGMKPSVEGSVLPAEVWGNWLEIQDSEPEWDFAEGGVRKFKIRITLPGDVRLGTYRFRLMISGVENPDEEYDESDPISFTVVGPEMNLQPFVIGAAAALALLIVAVIIMALLVKPRPSLKAVLDAPPDAVQGQPALYTLKISNTGEQTAENVTADYRLPGGIAAASAFVRGETVRHCDVIAGSIHCDMGKISGEGQVEINFQVIPGPHSVTITNTEVMTVSAQMAGSTLVLPVLPKSAQEFTQVSPGTGPYAVALNISTLTPVFEEDYTYQVLAWSNITTTQQMSFTFRLPAGMRYLNRIPSQCTHVREDYFTLRCDAELPPAAPNTAVTAIDIFARATAVTSTPATLNAETGLSLGAPQKRSIQTQVVNSALFFDGIQNWVQLGYREALKTFTTVMWVHPYTSDDGQSFLGLHREETSRVNNLFLVGYWSGGLQVNVNGDYHNLAMTKRADRFHLAVSVQNISAEESKVTVYVDGVEQEWEEPEDPSVCDRCKIFQSALPGGENPLAWVVGQDWDMGNQGRKTSDFFHGTLAEVQIWNAALSKDRIQQLFQVRPQGNESGLVAYYRLEPTDPASNELVSRVASAQPGKRIGATWVEAEPLYGTALRFNGVNNSLAVPGLQLQNLQPDADGTVEVTMAGWLMVDAVPSVQEWVLGSTVPTAGTLTLAPGASPETIAFATPSPADQAELASAQSDLLAAQQAAAALGLDANQVTANHYNARQRLILGLWNLVQDAHASADANIKLINSQAGQTIDPAALEATAIELGNLTKAVGVTPNISTTAATLQSNLAKIGAYKVELAKLDKAASSPSAAASINPANSTALSPDQAESLFFNLLTSVQQDLQNQSTAARVNVLSPEEAGSPNSGAIASARVDEYKQYIQLKVDTIDQLMTVLLASGKPSKQDLQQAAQQVGAAQKVLQDRASALRAETARLEPQQSTFIFGIFITSIDPRYIQNSARLVILDRFLQPLNNAYNLFSQAALLGVQSISAETVSPSANPTIPALSAAAQVEVERIKLKMLILDEMIRYYTNLKDLVQQAQNDGVTDILRTYVPRAAGADFTNLGGAINLYIQAEESIGKTPPYQVLDQLVKVDRLETDLVKISDQEIGAERLAAFQDLQTAQTDLETGLTGLTEWLQAGNDVVFQETLQNTTTTGPSEELRNYIAALATTQYNLKRYTDAQANAAAVQAAEARLEAAQTRVDAALAQTNSIQAATQQAQAEAEERQALENEVLQAQLEVSAARTPAEQQKAQARLVAAQTRLQQALLRQYVNLQGSMDGMLLREPVLADLDPRLNFAVDRAVDAAFSAMQRYNVERWIGPFLDLILGTRTARKSPQEAIRPAALLAAQIALKTSTDSKVDIAKSNYNIALEKQNTLANSGSNNTQRQRIIDQINAYIDSLNKDVTAAQKELDDAVAAQQGDLGESKIPLVLAEALAQAVADKVTAETIRLTPSVSTRSLLSSSAVLVSQAKQNVRGQIASALESARRPLRIQLYYQTGYLLQRLDIELASNGLSAQDRQLKANLRAQLASSNSALLRLLDAQNVLLKPAAGLGSLVGQVADASQSAASLEALRTAFEDALKNANTSLKAYLEYAQVSGQFKGVSLQGSTTTAQTSTSAAAGQSGATTPATQTNSSSAVNESTPQTSNVGSSNNNTTPTGQPLGQTSTQTTSQGTNSPGGQATATPILSGLGQTGAPEIAGSQMPTSTQTAPSGQSSSEAAFTSSLPAEPLNLWAGLMVDSDGHVFLAVRSASGVWNWEKDEKPLPVMQWVHYALVFRYDARSGEVIGYTLYRNGSPVKGDVSGNDPDITVENQTCPAGFYIGGLCSLNGQYYFDGRIDEVRVWNRALTQSEIEAWRKLPGVTYDEVAYWPFDDGPGHADSGYCDFNQTCDMAPGGDFSLQVNGPSWLDADAGLLSGAASRP